ncbi:MAG: DUF368 domain-containing protein [Bacteroidales bacterium]|nr:DUF368 domain-containing protein [Bacteroidales bacterium]
MRQHILTAIKGFFMGAANVIPGVSGGTVALITGIYGKIIDSINSVTVPQTWKDLLHGRIKAFWEGINGSFLLALAIGVVLSVFSLAKLMTYVLGNFPVQTWAFFFGLILASAVIMFRGIKGWTWKELVFALLGAALGVAICTLTPSDTPDAMWFIFICGALAICTMILPGISGSFVLLILGKYDFIMEALDLSNLNIPVLIAFGIGCVVGILAFAKFLHWVLGKWEKQTMVLLLGFIVGSLIKVWPWQVEVSPEIFRPAVPSSNIGWAILWALIGFGFVIATDIIGRRMEK